MARRYGNAGNVSSLISSARSAYEKSQSLQDQISELEWENSAKTADDAQKYIDYFGKRASTYTNTDPLKANTLQQKTVAAKRSFVAAELGRTSNQVLEGNASNSQKYAQMKSFYQQALDSGDENLAQRLYGQLDRLSMTIQSEQAAAAGAASAASDKAYTATKEGINADLKLNDFHVNDAEKLYKSGQIDRKTFLTKKKELLNDRQATLDKVAPRDPNSPIGFANPLGLKDQDLLGYAKQITDLPYGDNSKLLGMKGDEIVRGQSPYDSKINADGSVSLVDRPTIGYQWSKGSTDSPGTFAGGVYANNISSTTDKKYEEAFKKLGFDGGGATGKDFVVNGNKVRLVIDNPDNPKMAYYRTPNGSLVHVLPDGRYAGVISDKNGDYGSPLMPEQQKIAAERGQTVQSENDAKNFGLNGVGRVAQSAGEGFIKDITGGFNNMVKRSKPGTSFLKPVGNAIDQVSRIVGLQKMVEEKKRADAQKQAQILEANRAEAARQQASFQAQLAQPNNPPAAPGTTLKYNPLTGRVENKLSPVFLDPLAKDPNTRAQQVITGAVNGYLGGYRK